MICDFTSFLTVFQSYQDDVRMIMKGCVQWNSVYGWDDFTSSEDRTRSARSVGQRLTYWATGTPYKVENLSEVHCNRIIDKVNRFHMYRLVDNLEFNVFFNSISVKPRRWAEMDPRLRLKMFSPLAGLEPGTASSVGHRLLHWATGAPDFTCKMHGKGTVICFPTNFTKMTIFSIYRVCFLEDESFSRGVYSGWLVAWLSWA